MIFENNALTPSTIAKALSPSPLSASERGEDQTQKLPLFRSDAGAIGRERGRGVSACKVKSRTSKPSICISKKSFRTSKSSFCTSKRSFRTSDNKFCISKWSFRTSKWSFCISKQSICTSKRSFRISKRSFRISKWSFCISKWSFCISKWSFYTVIFKVFPSFARRKMGPEGECILGECENK
jgi:hypothetical protein